MQNRMVNQCRLVDVIVLTLSLQGLRQQSPHDNASMQNKQSNVQGAVISCYRLWLWARILNTVYTVRSRLMDSKQLSHTPKQKCYPHLQFTLSCQVVQYFGPVTARNDNTAEFPLQSLPQRQPGMAIMILNALQLSQVDDKTWRLPASLM